MVLIVSLQNVISAKTRSTEKTQKTKAIRRATCSSVMINLQTIKFSYSNFFVNLKHRKSR